MNIHNFLSLYTDIDTKTAIKLHIANTDRKMRKAISRTKLFTKARMRYTEKTRIGVCKCLCLQKWIWINVFGSKLKLPIHLKNLFSRQKPNSHCRMPRRNVFAPFYTHYVNVSSWRIHDPQTIMKRCLN